MTLGMSVVVIKGTMDVGHIGRGFQINYEHLRLNYFKIMYFAAPAFFIIALIVNIEGLVMFAYFNVVGCDPTESGQINNANQLLPHMVVRIFHGLPGLSGLFLASLFSASLSTISSGLSCLSAQTVQDFIKPRYNDMSVGKATAIAKVSVFFYGGMSVAVTALIANVSGCMSQGVVIGAVISMIFVFWISLGQNFFTSKPSEPWLPPNPTDQCSLDSTFYTNTTLMTNSTVCYNSSAWHPSHPSNTSSRITTYQKEMEIFNTIKA
ncbi:sodium-coupled monocarboxylate transporter 2-like [Mizuhopecten yessoensis]|uniref:sodium-coupled monocarboxylate transporter 2-like n=1 Tax=Mizuhopecten yessoensis TaxID=6573 RepID=UPI000B45AFEE|nr:sodium-coupled monocarboxylate transporter 2-like [Mizuhopecten yessoensis]